MVLSRCVASTKAFALMASAERRRLFARLAWHDDDSDAQLGRINISNQEAKRSMRSPTASTLYTTRPRATGGRGIETQPPPPHTRARLVRIVSPTLLPRRYARRPRRTLCSHNCQHASRKLGVHAVALCSPCAHHAPPLHCPGATRPRQACSRLTTRFRAASYCRRVGLVCD
jgi:hypothetical protein